MEKNGVDGVPSAGDDGPSDIESKLVEGMLVADCVRLRRGRSVGGRGAGPGFMNWPGAYSLDSISNGQDQGSNVRRVMYGSTKSNLFPIVELQLRATEICLNETELHAHPFC